MPSRPGDFHSFIPKKVDLTSSSVNGWVSHSMSSYDSHLRNLETTLVTRWFQSVSMEDWEEKKSRWKYWTAWEVSSSWFVIHLPSSTLHPRTRLCEALSFAEINKSLVILSPKTFRWTLLCCFQCRAISWIARRSCSVEVQDLEIAVGLGLSQISSFELTSALPHNLSQVSTRSRFCANHHSLQNLLLCLGFWTNWNIRCWVLWPKISGTGTGRPCCASTGVPGWRSAKPRGGRKVARECHVGRGGRATCGFAASSAWRVGFVRGKFLPGG